MLATADEVLLKGIGGISQEGRTVNLTAANGITLQSRKVINFLFEIFLFNVLFSNSL